MFELPGSYRELLVEALDEYCENIDETSDADAVSEAVSEAMEAVAEQVPGVEAEDIVNGLSRAGELEDGLVAVLASEFAAMELRDLDGERIVRMIERRCEIAWGEPEEEEEEGSGMFGEGVDFDDY